MARTRYVIQAPDKPHFLTCTVVEWLPVFTRPDAVQILPDSWTHQRANNPHALRAQQSMKMRQYSSFIFT